MQHYHVCHHLKAKCTKFDFRMGCTPDPLGIGLFKGPVSNLRGGKRSGKRWGGREGPVKSAKPRARKGLYASDVKSTKSEVRRTGIRPTCKFSSTRKRKEKRTEAAWTSMYVHANLFNASHVRICFLKVKKVKKVMP